jgi:glycosyltransferase involved in cell wall biosynthesis
VSAARPGAEPASDLLPISVVVPAYNRAELLPRALESIAAQRPRRPAEVIVVDDCSTDATGRVAAAMGARVIRHAENAGEGGSRNTGFRAAAQPWVALLDSDDEWLKHHLDALWSLRDDHILVAASALARAPDGSAHRVVGPPGPDPLPLTSPADLVYPENPVPASGVLVRRDVVLEVGGFGPSPFAADFDLWLRVLERGTGLVTPDVGYVYHLHEGQVSTDKGGMRAAQRALLEAYADRSWWSSAVLERFLAVTTWDELRAALASGRRRAAARHALSLAAHPLRLRALPGLWAWRAGVRHRTRSVRGPASS